MASRLTSQAVLTVQAPAKINLGLEVIRRRADGFHDLNTIFAPLTLFDTITLSLRSDTGFTLQISGNATLSGGDDNLCVKAARLLGQTLSQPTGTPLPGIDIHLTKRIPTGGGLGGGSADAAAVLVGAAQLWGNPVSPETLHQVGLMLGSDVPFFLEGGVAHAAGRGEILTSHPITLPWSLLLVNPGIHVATPWAFKALNRATERPATNLVELLLSGMDNPASLRGQMVNDFEEAVMLEYPAIKQIKQRMYDAGAMFALMSGSGSTLFGLFATVQDAKVASAQFPECWNAVARFHEGGVVVER